MSYSQGGIIAAADYNNFLNGSNQLNTVWSTGTGNAGYGQTALSTVSQSGTVTATQWATFINTLNNITTHQSGSGTGIGAPTAGTLINYLSTLSTSVNNAYTNRLNFSTQGTTTTGTVYGPSFTAANNTSAQTFTATRTVTFSSADQARYFFNCGGQLNFVIVNTSSNNNGTSRSGDLITLAVTNLATYPAFRAATSGGRSGSGGTLNTNATSLGYYGLTTSNQVLCKITTPSGAYANDYIELDVKSNGVQGSNSDVGTVITFTLTLYAAAQSAYAAPPAWGGIGTPPTNNTTTEDAINVTINHRIDIVYPETGNGLSNTWGTVSIA